MKCPILPNWMTKADGTCKRFELCDEERHKVCKAKPVTEIKVFSRNPKTCPHKYTEMVSTDEVVKIRGMDRKVFLIICKECGFERKTTL